MVFKLFVGETSKFTHERKMMDKIVYELYDKYKMFDNEHCFLLLNPVIYEHEIDGIVIKEDKIIILEMKDFKGKIIANCKYGSRWVIDPPDGPPFLSDNNPYFQVKNQREIVISFLNDIVNFDDVRLKFKLRPLISGWVVIQNNSEIEIKDLPIKMKKWFNVLQKNEVLKEVELATWHKFNLNENQIKEFIQKLNLEEREPKNWLHKGEPKKEKLDEKEKHLIVIEKKLISGIISEVKDGIKISLKLNLSQTLPLIILHKKNPNESVRELVIEAISYFNSEITSRILIELINDKSWKVRKKVLEKISFFNIKEAVPYLLELLNDNRKSEEEIHLIIKALSEIGDDRAIKPIIKLSNIYEKRFPDSKYYTTVDIFVSYLSNFNSIEILPFLENLIISSNEYILSVVIEALGKINHSKSYKLLKRFLNEDNPLLIDAIYALGDMGNKDYAKDLYPFLENENLFSKTVYALEKIDSKDSFDPIWINFERYIRQGKKNINEYRIIKFLIKLNPRKLEDKFILNYNCKNEKLKDLSQIFMQDVITKKSEKVIIPYLANPNDNTRYLTSIALLKLYKNRIPKFIYDYLNSNNEFLRDSAAMIIGFGLNESSLEYIEELKNDKSVTVRKTVAHLFWDIRNIQCAKYLVEMIDENDSEVLYFVLNGLNEIGYDSFDSTFIILKLKKIKYHKSKEIRREVAEAYRKVGKVECLDPLYEMLSDKYDIVQEISLCGIEDIGNNIIIPELNNLHLNPKRSTKDYELYEKFGKKLLNILKNDKNLIEIFGRKDVIYVWKNILELIQMIKEMERND